VLSCAAHRLTFDYRTRLKRNPLASLSKGVFMPKRIQRKRSKGWRMPENTVYVGRPSKWGNPYRIGENYTDDVFEDGKLVEILSWDSIDAKTAAQFFEEAITKKYPAVKIMVSEIVAELRGKDLACWCPLDKPCHADVLLRLANKACSGFAPAGASESQVVGGANH